LLAPAATSAGLRILSEDAPPPNFPARLGLHPRLPADLRRYLRQGRLTKLYNVKTAITAADLLNDRVLPFYEEHGIPLCRVLTDRGSEYCGNPERHEYELHLAIENIDHSQTKTKWGASGLVETFGCG
jgi:hypothetical protein